MDDAVPPPGSLSEDNFLDAALDFDLMDEMLSVGCSLETANCSELLQLDTPTSTSPFGSSGFSSVFEIRNSILNPVPPEPENHDDTERPAFSMNQPSYEIQVDNLDGAESLTVNAVGIPKYSIQSSESDSRNPSSQVGTSRWIQPRGSIVSVKERLRNALTYLKESQRYGDVLVQIWVPVRRGDRQVLTTYGQPFTLDTNCLSLVKFRTVSTSYNFSAEENSNEALGLPGRVFLSRVPEWTPDVRYFTRHEYPRIAYAEHCDVHGSIALPIFERGNQSCLGVMEVVMTARKINYHFDLENICNALQAVNLRSSEVLSFPLIKASNDSYLAALPEIHEVLRTVCNMHRFPLAQTWIPCIQQGKKGSRHSDENYKECVSTVDDACYVIEPSMLGFHEACSEHHLFRGQGVVGKAFTTNQPCFSSDITTFCKDEYPLAHHAKLFHLQAAVAIRLRSIHTSDADFVLEFFLPVDCWGSEEQKLRLNSLSTTIQQVCHSLRVVTAKELEDEAAFQANELIPSDISFDKSAFGGGDNFLSVAAHKGTSTKGSPRVANIMETQQKGISSVFSGCVPLKFNEQDTEIFGASTHWDRSEVVLPAGKIFTEFKQNQEDSDKDIIVHKDSFPGDPNFLNAGKATEKRRTKIEKTVSLQVLRQYFAGSLKDAAKSIGVCPTTLKRICRQHGITRWPSRKIKKVGHSLKKLQVVIDSVQGAEGAFQFSSVYEKFTKASGPDKNLTGSSTFSALKQKDHPEWIAHQQQEARLTSHTSASNSLSSSCSQSSSSGIACSSGTKLCSRDPQLVVKQEASMEEDQSGYMIKRAHSQVELRLPTEEPPRSMTRSQSHEFLGENLSSRSLSPTHKKRDEMFKVKAMYAEEKIRFKLQPTWCFQDLKQEIVKRFSIGNIESVDIKYLDDDDEWVLLRCDADLQECIDVYKLSHALTIKMLVCHVSQPVNRASITTQHCHEYERIPFH